MQTRIRRMAGAAAIVAIALHAVLWPAVASFAAPALDPFSVICHSGATGPADRAPANGALAPTHACDHCNLCVTLAPPLPNAVVAAYLAPAQFLRVLRPADIVPNGSVAADPKRARGPPGVV